MQIFQTGEEHFSIIRSSIAGAVLQLKNNWNIIQENVV